MINPEPRRSKISDKSPPVFGIIPHTNKAAFCKEKGSNGSSTSCKSSIFSYSYFSSKSLDSSIIFFSFILSIETSTGLLPSNKIGQFKILPPFSIQ